MYDRREAASRSGMTVAELDRIVAAGAIRPKDDGTFADGAIRRIAMIHTLEKAGVPLEGLAASLAAGELTLDFMDSEAYERFSALIDTTFDELAAESGLPVELLMLVREACGSAQPAPDDRVRESELAIVPWLQVQVERGFDQAAIGRLLRSAGDSFRRIAASEADWWRTEIIEPSRRAGLSPNQAVSPEFTDQFAALTERSMLTLYHAHQAQAWTQNILQEFEESLIRAGLHIRSERPPAMCFLDITGYTRLTQERGDAAAAQLADDLARLVQRTASTHEGRPIKWLGDGVMIWFRHPGPGVLAALEMLDLVGEAGLPPAHVGLHAGPVISQEGEFYGQTVNLAARISDYARPGELLVSQEVVDAATDIGVTFHDIGAVELKGVSGMVNLHSAHRQAAAAG